MTISSFFYQRKLSACPETLRMLSIIDALFNGEIYNLVSKSRSWLTDAKSVIEKLRNICFHLGSDKETIQK